MSRAMRIFIAVDAIVILVVAFVVLRPGGDDEKTRTTQTLATPPATTSTTSTTAAPPPAAPEPPLTRIVVRDGKPLGGVQEIKVTKGERVRIEVTSPDTSDDIHLHGYDLKRDLEAGGSVRFSFQANADGIYEIELEGAGVQIGKLVVAP